MLIMAKNLFAIIVFIIFAGASIQLLQTSHIHDSIKFMETEKTKFHWRNGKKNGFKKNNFETRLLHG